MLNLWHAVIFGVVEGFTEFLPISSTAHLILTAKLIGLSQDNFLKTFEIAIQAGAIIAVLILYWKKLLNIKIIKKLIVAFIPTGILGLIFYKLIKNYLLGSFSVILWSLALGGLLMILFEKFFKEKSDVSEDISSISYKKCFSIGLFQSIAMIPGVSRAAATILGGIYLGLKRRTIVEFSFLLAVPTMLAATGLDLIQGANFSESQFKFLAIGFLVSLITAVLSIKFLLAYIRKHNFTNFGFYRILIVFLFLIFLVF